MTFDKLFRQLGNGRDVIDESAWRDDLRGLINHVPTISQLPDVKIKQHDRRPL